MHQKKKKKCQNIEVKTTKILRRKQQIHIVHLFTIVTELLAGRIRQAKDI